VVANLLNPKAITLVNKRQVRKKIASKLSPMPEGMINMLTKEEILDLLAFLEAGGYKVPDAVKKGRN